MLGPPTVAQTVRNLGPRYKPKRLSRHGPQCPERWSSAVAIGNSKCCRPAVEEVGATSLNRLFLFLFAPEPSNSGPVRKHNKVNRLVLHSACAFSKALRCDDHDGAYTKRVARSALALTASTSSKKVAKRYLSYA